MDTKRLKNFMTTAALLSLPLLAVGLGALTPGEASVVEREAALADVMAMADAAAGGDAELQSVAPFDLAQATEEVRGEPLNAAQAEEKEEVRGAPLGAAPEAGADPDTEGMSPIRTIPQESLDLMEKLDGGAPMNPDELVFEKTKNGKFSKVTFGGLSSFQYEIPDPEIIRESQDPFKAPVDQIPSKIRELDGEPVVVVGFMVPIEIDRKGNVESFALTVNQTFCCFGVPPAMNEWLMVEMEEGHSAPYTMDVPVAAYGMFHVGEEIEDGYVLSIYRMTADEVIDVHELLKRTDGDAS